MKDKTSGTILLVSDEGNRAKAETKTLEEHGYTVITAFSGKSAIEIALSTPGIDLILLDAELGPDLNGIQAAETILKTMDVPMLFLINHTEPEIVERTERVNSYGYIVKNSGEAVLLASIRTALKLHDARRELKKNQAELEKSKYDSDALTAEYKPGERKHIETLLFTIRKAVDCASDAIGMSDPQGRHFYNNKAFTDLFGYTAEELDSTGGGPAVYTDQAIAREVFDTIMRGGSWNGEIEMKSKSGRTIPVLLRADAIKHDSGQIVGLIGVHTDLTKTKQAEQEQAKLREQLVQSQKMETVGLLAGGVAHDFNNLLTPVIGYSEFMLLDLPQGSPEREKVEQVLHAAERMKFLTSRLLSFSHKQILDLKVIDIGDVISEFEHMAHRVIRENIEIKTVIESQLGRVSADRGQIEQVLLNLAVNAQEAMPKGGLLIIEARNADLDESYTFSHPEVMPGPYVMFSVSDTGMGMDEKTQEHLFEPFFSTKERGKGTGLGLATIYGIVKRHGGSVSAYSEKHKGAIFKIFLPRVTDTGESISEEIEFRHAQRNYCNETVLVVEDDEPVRVFTCKMLEDLGYRVLTAENVDRCIELAYRHSGAIDLLLTDVIMPNKNGKEVYNLLSRDRPEMKVLFISGYTGDVIGHHGILDEGVNFLQKPFTLRALSQKVKSTLAS